MTEQQDIGRSNKGKNFLDGKLVQQTIHRILGYQQGLIQKKKKKNLLNGLSTKSPSDLSMRIPSTVGQICHEMPPNPRSYL